MTDLYLKFPDQQTADDVLQDYTGSVDVIGVIYERTGGTDDEPVMTAKPGWHVNTRGSVTDEMQAYAVKVDTPVRVWA